MSRSLGLLVFAALLSALVAVFIWMRGPDEPNGHHVRFAQTVDQYDLEPADVPVDPNAAVAAIHAVRSQFGSVLANTELDVVDAGTNGVNDANGPNSFEEFLNEAAGLTNPPSKVDAASPTHKTVQLSPAIELAQSLRETATLLVERAQQAEEIGDVVQQQRYFALAMLLRAEAEVQAPIRQASR